MLQGGLTFCGYGTLMALGALSELQAKSRFLRYATGRQLRRGSRDDNSTRVPRLPEKT